MIRRRKPIDRGSTPIARSPLKRGTKPIPSRSERVFAQLPERARVVNAAWDRDRGQCQAEHLVPDVRCCAVLDPHEIIPRSAWAAGVLEVDNVMIVCRNHHRWIDAHPHAAHSLGLHGYSWERT